MASPAWPAVGQDRGVDTRAPMLDRPADLDALILRRPPSRTLRWAEGEIGPGTVIQRVRPLEGAWASAVHAFDVAAPSTDPGRHFVLRRHVWTEAVAQDPGLVSREVATLRALQHRPVGVATPEIVAADPDGTETDVPTVLQTLLPGRVIDAPPDPDGFARRLAWTAAAIWAGRTGGLSARYRPWNAGMDLTAPSRSRRHELWDRAIAVFGDGPPEAGPPALVHRDFHPGNVLWRQGSVSGVVDWVHACVGPPAVDVAHCRLNLVVRLDLGRGCADALRDEAIQLGATWDPWFDIAEVISWLPIPRSSPPGWFPRAQQHLERALAELGR